MDKRYIWTAWVGRTIIFCASIEESGHKFTRIILDDGRGYDFGPDMPFTVGWENRMPPSPDKLRGLIEETSWGKPA